MAEARTQESRILWQLQAAFPSWVPAPSLSAISLQYGSRIHALRKKGWQIANKVEVRDGVKHGYFRLATPGSFPNPRKCEDQGTRGVKNKTAEAREQIGPALPSTGSRLLFRDLPAAYRDPEEV
jgi:hypothetical protein